MGVLKQEKKTEEETQARRKKRLKNYEGVLKHHVSVRQKRQIDILHFLRFLTAAFSKVDHWQ